MSASRPLQQAPWPAPTPPPPIIIPQGRLLDEDDDDRTPHPPAKRRKVFDADVDRRRVDSREEGLGLARRQTIADQSLVQQAMQTCQIFSGNEVISCFPTESTVIPQKQWASFVWNSNRPDLRQTNLVDVFLFRADSQQQLLHFRQLPNPTDQAGLIRAQVNDTWFGADGLNWQSGQSPFPFQWVLIRSDKTLDGNQVPQPIFTAVQTTVLDSVAASSSSASAASSSSSAAADASSSSASVASSRSVAASNPNATGGGSGGNGDGTGNVQHASSAATFPHWAIAVIVVLGFLAISAMGILFFLLMRRYRRRRSRESMRNSMGSSSPMIVNRDSTIGPAIGGGVGGGGGDMAQRYDPHSPGSPLLPPPSLGGGFMGVGVGRGGGGGGGGDHSTHDGASTISDSGGPFSGADAAIMADAFRKMLRKPDFAGRPVEEGESPEQQEAAAAAAAAAANGEGSTGGMTPPRARTPRLGGAQTPPRPGAITPRHEGGVGPSGLGGPPIIQTTSASPPLVGAQGHQNPPQGLTHPEVAGTAVMSRELAEEGRDIRSVSSSREVMVDKTPLEGRGRPGAEPEDYFDDHGDS